MRAPAIAIAFGALVLAAAAAQGHSVPPRRTVTVQAEKAGAAVLVTWTSARGPQGAQMLGRAAWGRSARATDALRALASAEALRGLEFETGGVPVSPKSAKIKVRVDTGNSSDPPRIVCVVLLSFESKRKFKSELVVRSVGRVETGIRWIDKSVGRARSTQAAGKWLGPRRTLRLSWR